MITMDIDCKATKNSISSEDMNEPLLPSTVHCPTAKSEVGLCGNQSEMASFTSFVSASRSAVGSENSVSSESSSNSPLPENLTTRFQKLSLGSTSDDSTPLTNGVILDGNDDHDDDPVNDDCTADGVFSPSDVDMGDEITDDADETIPSHRNKFDRIRLDDYRAHLVDTASEVIQSFYNTCNVRLDSTNNNSNIDSMPAVLATSFTLDIPHAAAYPHGDIGITLPISTRYQPLGLTEKPVSPSRQAGDIEKRRPRKRVSFTSAPSIKWFRKDDKIELPPRTRRGKNHLIAVLRQLVLSQKKSREESKLKVIPILKKRYKRLKV